MTPIRKAVITAAGRGIGLFPAADTVQKGMLPLMDRDGVAKPLLQLIAEEAMESGIEELCVICAPGDEAQYHSRFLALRENLLQAYKGVEWAQHQVDQIDKLLRQICFRPQEEALGYGDAVLCARDFVDSEPFLLLLSDHIYVSDLNGQRCAQQLMALAKTENCSVAAVNPTRESLVGRYGTLTGERLGSSKTYRIKRILEKPSLSQAELELTTPGLRSGHFLCLFGMHVLEAEIFDLIQSIGQESLKKGQMVQLTPALEALAQQRPYLALEIQGRRFDVGSPYGLLKAQVAIGLSGQDKETVLSTLLESLAESQMHQDR